MPMRCAQPAYIRTGHLSVAYRGAGRPEASFAIERVLDELAAELDIDPIELRRRNWISEFPHTIVSGG